MDKSKLAIEVDSKIVQSLLWEVTSLYNFVDCKLPDCIAKKFALDDLSSVESYFNDYLIPIDNGKSK